MLWCKKNKGGFVNQIVTFVVRDGQMTTRYETTKIETAITICRIETIYSIGFGNYLGSFDLSVDSQIRTISTQILVINF